MNPARRGALHRSLITFLLILDPSASPPPPISSMERRREERRKVNHGARWRDFVPRHTVAAAPNSSAVPATPDIPHAETEREKKVETAATFSYLYIFFELRRR